MPELATAWVTLAVNTRGMQTDIRRAFGDVDAEGQGRRAGQQFGNAAARNTNLTGIEQKLAQAGQRGVAALGSILRKGAIGAGAAMAGAIGTSLALGFSRLSSIDDAQAKLRGLGHDAGTVAKVMDNALASVRGTAFGLGDAAGLAGVIVASGIKPGQELETVLKRVADSAAISGSSLSDMGSIWAKAAAQGKLDGEIVAQLLGRQIPIYDILAEKMGVQSAEIAKMVSKGKVSFQDFSDAMNDKLAGSALKTGETVRGAFDNLKAAMGRLGAEALKPGFTQLPAVLTAATTAVDNLTPSVKAFAQQMSSRAMSDWIPRVREGWEALRDNDGVRSGLREAWQTLRLLAQAAGQVAPPLLQIGSSIGQATASLGISSWKLLVVALQGAAGALDAMAVPLQIVADLMENHQGAVTAAVLAYAAFRGIPAILGRLTPAFAPVVSSVNSLKTAAQASRTHAVQWGQAWNQSMAWMRQANPQLSTTGAAFRVLGANAGAAARGGLSAIRSAGAGVIGALGGPLSAALMAAGAAFMFVSSQNQKAAQGLKAYEQGLKRVHQAQVNLDSELMRSGGAIDETVSQSMVDRVKAVGEELDGAGQKAGSFLDQFRDAQGSLLGGFKSQIFDFGGTDETNNLKFKIDQQAEAARNAKGVLDDLAKSEKDLTDAVYGGQGAFDALVNKLNESGEAGQDVANKLRDARQVFLNNQAAAQQAAPGLMDMAEAMRVLSDNTASAADKTRALTNALSALNPERTQGDAIAAHDQALSAIAEATQNATDQTQGYGQALLNANGSVDTATRNGQALRTAISGLVDVSAQAVASGQSLEEVNNKNMVAIQSLATQYGLSATEIQAAFDNLGGKDLTLMATLAGADETIQSIGMVARAFEGVPDSKEITIKADSIAGSEAAIEALGFKVEEIDGMPGTVRITADTDDALSKLGGILAMLSGEGGIPQDVPIKVTDQGGQAVYDLLKSIGVEVTADNDKSIKVAAPLADDVKKKLADIGVEVKQNNDKTIQIKLTGVEAARNTINGLTGGQTANVPAPRRADGAIVPMANGGFRQITKPTSADIYAGRGAGTIFAERETGGEAYIPMAPGKRNRSTAILGEVARLFGYDLLPMEDGGITVEAIKRFASQIAGRPYAWGAGNGDTFDTDCSGAQSTIANYVTGGTGRFSTAGQSAALLARGFRQGDPPDGISAYWVGWVNGGPGGGHTAGTIVDPYGGNVNVEMGGRGGNGQYGGSAAGAAEFPNRAWVALASGDDPNGSGMFSAKSQRAISQASAGVSSAKAGVTSAQASVDSAKSNVAKLKADGASADKIANAEQRQLAAEQRLTAAQERLGIAEDKLTEAQQKATRGEGTGDKSSGGGSGGEDLGQAIFGGILQSLGLDGSVFSNPLEWPNFKSAMALANWGGGLLKGAMGAGQQDDQSFGSGGGSMDLGGLMGGLGIGNLLPSETIGPTTPNSRHGDAGGSEPGPGAPLVQYNGPVNMGVDPTQHQQKQAAHLNMAYRGNQVRQ